MSNADAAAQPPVSQPSVAEFEKYIETTPKKFDVAAVEARLKFDQLSQARPPETKPLREYLSLWIALVTAAVGMIVSLLNVVFYFSDRVDKDKKEIFENQVAISKIYFEKIAPDFCKNTTIAPLFVKVTREIASSYDGTRTRLPAYLVFLEPAQSTSAAESAAAQKGAITRIADAISESLTGKSPCAEDDDASDDAEPSANANNQANVVDLKAADPKSSYAAKNQVAAQVPAGSDYTVYIQYKANSAAAEKLRADIRAKPGFKSPALEKVARSTTQNEIRVYRETDISKAVELRSISALSGAKIVNLASVYKSLPNRTMEIWLKD